MKREQEAERDYVSVLRHAGGLSRLEEDPARAAEALKDLPTGKRAVEEVLETYFEACASALAQSRRAIGVEGVSRNDATAQARRVWALFNRARVFVFDVLEYVKVYRGADKHTATLAGFNWDDPDATEGETRHLYKVYLDEAERVPFPRLPFDAVYLGLGKHLALDPGQMNMRMSPKTQEVMGVDLVQLYGFILGVTGDVREAYAVVRLSGRGANGVGFVATYMSDRSSPGYGREDWRCDWLQPATLDPWVIPRVVEAIEERSHLTLERPGLSVKLARKAVQKRSAEGALPIPMPYYVVKLGPNYAEGSFKQPSSGGRAPTGDVSYSHRWDVRGHDCVRVARGELPLDPEVGAKLRERGYTVYDAAPVSPEHAELLKRRGLQRGPDEWVAVLVYRREAHVRGPEGAPYVPAARVLI